MKLSRLTHDAWMQVVTKYRNHTRSTRKAHLAYQGMFPDVTTVRVVGGITYLKKDDKWFNIQLWNALRMLDIELDSISFTETLPTYITHLRYRVEEHQFLQAMRVDRFVEKIMQVEEDEEVVEAPKPPECYKEVI